ncbi:hypothetical protein HAZT_HAZT010916 [Hyalella azteca]|uniref:Myosin tail domain-containing protein n=1 Tax=Hyalella azteca TaxID=294128 RepID=A0A6A0GY68_HYAAZ|nr:hypothetical protein HAZT_HAZT010916 [Hyalella azteca]
MSSSIHSCVYFLQVYIPVFVFFRLKKDLRKTKALLKDTQTMLEKTQTDGPSKLIIRQLKTQDCEFAKTAALKARQSADADLAELQVSLEDAQRCRKEAEDRSSRLLKEKTELQTQLEENEELHAETLKKYKSTVSQISVDQITLSEQSQRIAELEQEKQLLSERLLELSSKVEVLEGETANIHTQRMLQMKVKELESKLELELATKKRIESQVTRLKEQVERLSGECDLAKVKESQSLEQNKKLGRQLRQAKEEAALFEQRNTELNSKKQELEKQMEIMESEVSTLKSDLKLAFKRIEDLQVALQGDISDSDSELSDSDTDSDTSLTRYLSSRSTARPTTSATGEVASAHTLDQAANAREDDVMSPGGDAMARIEEAQEDEQRSESFA